MQADTLECDNVIMLNHLEGLQFNKGETFGHFANGGGGWRLPSSPVKYLAAYNYDI